MKCRLLAMRGILALLLLASSVPWQGNIVFANDSALNSEFPFMQEAIPDGPFGITNIIPSWNEAINYAEARAGYWAKPTGATWDRWTIDWSRVESGCDQQFTWTFENLDYALGIPKAHAQSLNVVAVLRGAPGCYLDMSSGHFSLAGLGNLGESVFDANGQIKQNNSWARYVYEVATTYGEYIDAWEIFNEIDHENEWVPNTDPETKETLPWYAPEMNTPEGREFYLRVLEVASEVLRHVDKTQTDKIILGSPLISSAVDAATNENSWYRLFLQQIGGTYAHTFDAIALHAYGRPKNTYLAIRGVRWFDRLNEKPIWMTETGVVAAGTQEEPNYPPNFPEHNSCGGSLDPNHGQPCGDDTEMASYVIQQYIYALYSFSALGSGMPGKVFHHQLKDDAGMEKWGLLSDVDPFARPAYTAITVAVDNLQNALFIGNHSDVSQDKQGFYRFDFDKDGHQISVLWSRSNDNTVDVLVPGVFGSALMWNQSGQALPSVYVTAQSAYSITLAPGTNRTEPIPAPGESSEWMIGGPPLIFVQGAPDQDGDYIPDAIECPPAIQDCSIYDTDGDGKGNYIDSDSDNDGISDTAEWIIDIDQNGVVDGYDRDRNSNSVWDFQEYDDDSDDDAISNSIEGQVDSDQDGLPNCLDIDSDNDTILDKDEATCTEASGVIIGDGLLPCNSDATNVLSPTLVVTDTLPDYRDLDSDGDGFFDLVEAGDQNPATPPHPGPLGGSGIPAFRNPNDLYRPYDISLLPTIESCNPTDSMSFQQGMTCGLEMIRAALANAGIAVTLDDPPVPALLFAFTPYPRPANGAQAVLTTTTTPAPASLSVTRAASHTLVAGDLQATWTTSGWSAAQFVTLTAGGGGGVAGERVSG